MVDGIVSHKCNCVKGDPLPEGDVVRHGVRLHLALHIDVEDLKGFGGWLGGGGKGAGTDPKGMLYSLTPVCPHSEKTPDFYRKEIQI